MAITDEEQQTRLPNRQSYVIFGVVAAAFLFSSVNSTIVAVALPTMLDDLHTSLAWVGWTLTGFQLGQGIVMPLSGKLSDDWGARRVFLGSIVLFTVSSVLAGAAPDVYVLIFARILQALGVGAMMPSATSIVSDAFGEKRAMAIGMFTSIFPLGGVLGPSIGGLVIDHFSWRWLFYANGPIGVVVIFVGLLIIPRGERLGQGSRVDAIGVGLFSGAMIAVLTAMTAWSEDVQSLVNPVTWLVVALGAAALVAFYWHEGRTSSPVIELELLRSRPFFAANVYNFLYGVLLFGFSSFIPYYANIAYGMSAGESGAMLAPRSALMAIASTVSSVFLIRLGYRLPMILGLLLNTASLLLVSQGYRDVSMVSLQVPNLVLLSSMVLLSGAGHGISAPPSNNASLDLAPRKIGAVVGLRGMFRQTGGMFGTAAIILALSHYDDKAAGMQTIFLALGLLNVLVLPVVFMIPDIARQRYVAAREVRQRETA